MIEGTVAMTMEKTKIGFVGGGNMAEAFIGALLQSKIFRPEQVLVSDVLTERLKHLEKTYGIAYLQDNAGLYDGCNIVLLAVKPQQMYAVLTEIADRRQRAGRDRKLILSIAAGFPCAARFPWVRRAWSLFKTTEGTRLCSSTTRRRSRK